MFVKYVDQLCLYSQNISNYLYNFSFFLASSDYSTVHQEVIFSPGDSRTVVSIPILDDDISEDDEIFIAVLTDSNNSHISANIKMFDTDG